MALIGTVPRVLALHGFRTSGAILQQQVVISGLREFFKGRVEVTYLDGPHAAAGEPAPDVKAFFQPPYYEWWNVATDPVTGAKDYRGCEEALQYVADFMRQRGPFVGLLGFSQGSTLAGLVALLQQAGHAFQDVPRLQFLLLFSGSKNLDRRWSPLYQVPLTTPTVIVIGDQDPNRAAHDALVECVQAPLVLRHPRGHLIPRLSGEQASQLDDFLFLHKITFHESRLMEPVLV